MANLADQTENLILHRKCLNRQSERNGSGGSLKTNRITCEGYANLTVCVLCLLSVYPSTCVSVTTVIPLIQYPSFPTGFSGVFCQDMIDSCWAKPVLSDVRLCVWPSLNRSAVSDLCLSHRRTVGHLWGKWQTTQRSALGFVCVCVCYSTLQWCLSGECVSRVSRGKACLPATLLFIHHSCW